MKSKDRSPAERVQEFLAEVGFIWGPEPEIYGGLAGFYTYAPLGKQLKQNVEQTIRQFFIREEFWEVECPTIMPAIVWEASGHLGGFSDPLISCSGCKSTFRVDKLIEEFTEAGVAGKSHAELLEIMVEHKLKCPSCGKAFIMEIKKHSLMMGTTIGVDTEAYNRPETATTTYLPFLRYVDFFRKILPFGVFQIGKAYRNEISPRQHVTRGREFTQAEAQLFLFSGQKKEFEKFSHVTKIKAQLWSEGLQKKGDEPIEITFGDALKKGMFKNKAYAWGVAQAWKLFLEIGIPAEKMRLRQHHSDEKAFYADDAWDLEINTHSFGWLECCGVHDRTDYDLKQHAQFSKQRLVAFNEETKQQEIPHIIEIAFGTDRPTYALLDLHLDHKEDGGRVVHIPAKLAPVSCGIFPLMNKPELISISQKLFREMLQNVVCVHEHSGTVGKRYARNDEKGVPFCITVDYDSIEKGDVTIRDRDTTKQVRVKIKDVVSVIKKLVNNEIKFSDLK